MRTLTRAFPAFLVAILCASCADSGGGGACTVSPTDLPVLGAFHEVAAAATTVTATITAPALATSGATHLAVWRQSAQVYAARLDAQGAPLDSPPQLVADDALGRDLAAAWDGARFLVSWVDAQGAVRVTPVSSGGVPAASSAALSAPAIPIDGPVLASSGAQSLLVWATEDAVIHGARLGADGAWLDAAPFQVASPGRRPQVVWDGSSFVTTWTTNAPTAELRAARVDASGQVLDPGGVLIAPASGCSLVARDHGSALAFVAGDAASQIQAVRLAPDLTVLDVPPVHVMEIGFPEYQWLDAPRLARSGDGRYVLGWGVRDDTSSVTPGARALDEAFAPVGAPFQDETSHDTVAALLGLPGLDFLAVLGSGARRLRSTAAALEADATHVLSTSAAPQASPVGAGDGDGYLVAWAEGDAAGSPSLVRLRARFLGADGAPTSAPAFDVGAQADYWRAAQVAWDGARYLVGAQRLGGGLEISVVEPGVGVTGAHVIAAGPAASFGLACSGATCLAAWGERSSGVDEIRGSFVRADGTLEQPGGALLLTLPLPSFTDALTVRALGDAFGLFWENGGARVDALGTVTALPGFTRHSPDSQRVLGAGPDTVLAVRQTAQASAPSLLRAELLRFDGSAVVELDLGWFTGTASWDGVAYLLATDERRLQVITAGGALAGPVDMPDLRPGALAPGRSGQTLVLGTTAGPDGVSRAGARVVQRAACE
jgi:YD repeat-containing protein